MTIQSRITNKANQISKGAKEFIALIKQEDEFFANQTDKEILEAYRNSLKYQNFMMQKAFERLGKSWSAQFSIENWMKAFKRTT